MDTHELLKVPEAAERLRVSRSTIYERIAAGELRAWPALDVEHLLLRVQQPQPVELDFDAELDQLPRAVAEGGGVKGWLHSLLAPSRAEEARVEEKVEQELPAFPISNEVAQALGAELARMVLPFFLNAIRQQAAEQVEEERGEQTLAALKRAVAMSQGAIAETRRS